jgi:hypothetical protein
MQDSGVIFNGTTVLLNYMKMGSSSSSSSSLRRARTFLRAAAHQLRQDKHQDMRQKKQNLTSASWLRPVCGGFHNLNRFNFAPFLRHVTDIVSRLLHVLTHAGVRPTLKDSARLYHPVFTCMDFATIYRARSSALRPTPNLDDQVPVVMSPSDSVAQLYLQPLGSLFVASYDSQV